MPRRYVQRARAETAEQTRRQMLDAARDAVLAEGPLELSTGQIAAAAGVARSTIYAAFGSRAGLLSALAEDTLHRAGLETLIAESRQPDPVDALERVLLANCRMYAAGHRVFVRLIVLGEIDPDAAVPIARSQANRAMGLAGLAALLAEEGRLRPGVSVERARDLLSVLTSFWTFDELYRGRGLPADECAEILIGIAQSSLLNGDALPAPSRR
jgi:AcrR family transcriptional regulator